MPSVSELRDTSWTRSLLERLWENIEAHAPKCAQFRKDWRVNARLEYKLLREELYPLLWYMRHATSTDEISLRLTPAGDVWDAQMQSPGGVVSKIQITLAYRIPSNRNQGYENALRMECINDVDRAPVFGGIERDRKTRNIIVEPAALERGELISAYANGIIAALKRKQFANGQGGNLIVFIDHWLRALGSNGFASVMSRIMCKPVAVSFDIIHVVGDEAGCFQVFSCDPDTQRLVPCGLAFRK